MEKGPRAAKEVANTSSIITDEKVTIRSDVNDDLADDELLAGEERDMDNGK